MAFPSYHNHQHYIIIHQLMGGYRVKKTQEQFVEECKNIHGDKYDYSKVRYINNKSKVCIVCKKHGEFWQEAGGHLKGYGCRKCHIESKKKWYRDLE